MNTPSAHPWILGLTGGIGSGKSAAAEHFAALGVHVVDADHAARWVVEPGRPALGKIAEHFGEQVLQADGQLNRGALRTLIFSDPEQRRWLEALLQDQRPLNRVIQLAHIARPRISTQAVRARDELVAVVSHDLRNPMTIISMLCGMMQKAFSSEGPHTSRRITSAIDTMQQASSRMSVLLDDLLDTSKIEAGRYTISPQPLDVTQMFEEALSLLAPLALDKAVELTFHAEPDLKINADPERLFQVLSNLIGNAIKFTPAQGKIGVVAMSNGDDIVFSVRDSGKGIAPEQLPHIFDRYWTAKEGNALGTGLGLYISQGIIKAHGGQLVAQSTPGEGSEFRFTVSRML